MISKKEIIGVSWKFQAYPIGSQKSITYEYISKINTALKI